MGRDAAYSLNDNDCRHYINDLCAHACPEATRGRNVSSLVAWQTTWGRLRGGRPHESLYILPLFLCGLMVGAAGAGSGGARPGAEVCTGGAGHVLAAAKSVGAAAAAAVTWVTAEAVVAAESVAAEKAAATAAASTAVAVARARAEAVDAARAAGYATEMAAVKASKAVGSYTRPPFGLYLMTFGGICSVLSQFL